ncbi:MAG: outer membrane protein assembly factor BamA [Acidobacteriota bacterium]|nr:outer membrane protein assembly factor BamA [Acidobacteriota bacterium]
MPQLTYRWMLCLSIMLTGFAWPQDNVIEEIIIQGNRRFPEDSIRYRISNQVGDVLDSKRVTSDIKAIWETGEFDNVRVGLLESETGGVVLVYDVSELPLVVEVDYRGNKKLTKSSITDKVEEERLTIAEDDTLDYGRINAIRRLIKGIMDERGLRFGTVNYTLERLDAGTARVVFNIEEGSRVRIFEIEFDGNEVFTDRRLRKTMKKTKEKWFFSWVTGKAIFKEESFAEDVDKLKARYWKRGYKDIYIEEPVIEITDHTTEKQKRRNEKRKKKRKPIREDKRMKLTIPVFEGRAYTMGDLNVEGNTVLKTGFYQETFPIKKGEVYDLGKINKWIEDFEEMHNNFGYVNYNVEQNVEITGGDVVNANFKVNERDQVYINLIDFTGNTTTRDKVLRREILLREGDVFRVSNFRNSLLRVNQLGFFDITNHDPKVDFLPGENKVNLTINGQESGVNELNFGLGFSEFRGTSGFLSFSTLNFMGKGEKLKVQAQVGSITSTYDITFTEPWLFDKPRGVTGRIFNTRTDFDAAGFDLESTGFQAGFSLRPSIFSTYSISYRFSEDRFPTVTSPAFKKVDDLLTSSITQTLAWNTTDHPFFPTKGRKYSLALELASWQVGGDNFFYKVRSNATHYLPAIRSTFIGVNVEGGYLSTLEGQRPTQNQLFFLGGEESVRGYQRRSLGPAVVDANNRPLAILGDKMVRANFEYIVPVSAQFRFVMFYDTGMVFGVDEGWFDRDLARSVGLEMRFSLPVFNAPLRLFYAYRLDDTEFEEKGGDPDFAIGTTF